MLACNSFYLHVLLLPVCHSFFQAYIVYLDSRVLVQCAYVLHAANFYLRVNLQKTCVYGCAHAVLVILNAGTVRASIKFKSSCTVAEHVHNYVT